MGDTQEEVRYGSTVRAFDIPATATPDESAELVNERCKDGFYLAAIVAWPGVGARVFLKLHQKPGPKPGLASWDKKEAAVLQFIRDHREMTAKELSAACKALGHPRGEAWVNEKRAGIIRAERLV